MLQRPNIVVNGTAGGSGGGGAGVESFKGRTGVVLPQNGDYTPSMVGASLVQQLYETPLTAPATVGGSGVYHVLSGIGDITLPSPATSRVLILHAVNGSSITLIVAGGGSINGELSYEMAPLEAITVIADGATNWRIN